MALPARKQPLGLNAQYIAHNGEELVLKERLASLSGDSFHVTTAAGQPVVQVKGEAFSLSGRKHVQDLNGNNLFDIRKQHFALFSTYYCEDANKQKVMEVKSKFSSMAYPSIYSMLPENTLTHFSVGTSKATVTFNNALAGGQPVELSMKGDFLDRKADIVDTATGEPVASIRKKSLNMRNLLGGQQTYIVAVAPGVDISLIVAMCVCFDEKNNESSSSGGLGA